MARRGGGSTALEEDRPSRWIALYLLLIFASVARARPQDHDRSSAAHDADDADEAARSAGPLHVDRDRYIARVGQRLMVACVFRSSAADQDPENEEENDDDDTKSEASSPPHLHSMSALQWLSPSGQSIDGESSASIFTIALFEHGTKNRKRSLHFPAIAPRDKGRYTCEARDEDGHVWKKEVDIVVIDALQWKSSAESVGGLLGEPLAIECDANGEPEPAIEIVGETGEPLDEALWKVVGTQATVEELTKEHDQRQVSCIALQELRQFDTTDTEQRDVVVHVWYAPEFASGDSSRYAIVGRTAHLHCNVTASNPRAQHFSFSRDGSALTASSDKRYSIHIPHQDNTHHQPDAARSESATLTIRNVKEEDFGAYRCDVNNGKAKSHHVIHLKQARAPDEVRVAFVSATKHSITLALNEDEGDELPVERFHIQYIRREVLERASLAGSREEREEEEEDSSENSNNHEEEEDEERFWRAHAVHVVRAKDPISADHYVVSGLRADTDYELRVRAASEAGLGEAVRLSVRTASNRPVEEEEDDEDGCASIILSLPLLLMALVLSVSWRL